MSITNHPETAAPAGARVADHGPAAPPSPPATLADLLRRIQAERDLPPARRRDLASSLRSFGRITSRPLETIGADPPSVRDAMRPVIPRAAGITVKRWANIRSDLGFLLARYGTSLERRPARHLSSNWRRLRAALPDEAGRRGLSRFLHFCSDRSIPPDRVTPAVFDAYHRHLVEEALVRKPRDVHRNTCRQWNRAACSVSGWPQVRVAVPSFSNSFALPREAFPPGFRDEVERWARSLAGIDLLDDGPARPLRPISVEHARGQVYRFASALVHRGHDPATITGMADLVQPERFKDGLRFFIERRGGKTSPGLSKLAALMTAVARHWVKLGEPELGKIRHLRARTACRATGLTEKNRRRLRQFDDPAAQAAVLGLPDRLVTMARRGHGHAAALRIQTALLIALLLHAPIRLANLEKLHLHKHFQRRGRGRAQVVHLVLAGEEVKTGEPLEYPLPPDLVHLLDRYVATYRPLLLRGEDRGWLWPGRRGGAKHRRSLCSQIQEALRRHAGVEMNVHLFRHLAGKLSLLADPGNYEQVRRLLGHTSIDTTTRFYTGFDTAAAARRYHEQVLRDVRRPREARP